MVGKAPPVCVLFVLLLLYFFITDSSSNHKLSFCIEKECINYSVLSAKNRSSTFNSPEIGPLSCDGGLSPGWYRFLPPAGNQMASTCVVSGKKCGTAVTGWLKTTHPKTADGIVSGKVCFSWEGNCCMDDQDIHVRDCGRFFVYKLAKTTACPMRFCGETTV